MISRAQQLQAFAQRRARHAQLLGQTPFRRQGLAGLEHAVQDQALDALGHFVRHLAGFSSVSAYMPTPDQWYDQAAVRHDRLASSLCKSLI